MSERPDLSIVAPMFNEEANVSSTIERIKEAMAGFGGSWEFVMVNDGSTDGTLAEAERLAASEPNIRVTGYAKNAGRGRALRWGFAEARGRIVATVDFDLSYTPDHVLRMYEYLETNPQTDIVLASAYMPGGKVEGVPAVRLFASQAGNEMLMYAFDGHLHTTTCVVRAYRREALELLDLESDGKEIHLEVIEKAQALGLGIAEIPATLRGRKKGKSKFRPGGTIFSHLSWCFALRPMMFFAPVAAIVVAYGFVRSLNPFIIISGVQLFALGLVAGLVSKLHRRMLRAELRMKSGDKNPANDAPKL